MSDQVKKATHSKTAGTDRPKRRSWLRWFLWALLLISILTLLLAILVWTNRYSLIEDQARKKLSNLGIEAEFEIEEINRSGAVFNDMQFSDEDGPFFSADQLVLDYRFEQLRAGIVDKIVVEKPTLRLTLDGSANVIDRWVPETSEESEPFVFPKDGVFIEDGFVNWAAPWGAGVTGVSAQIQSETEWKSQIDMQSARIATDDIEIDYGFVGDLNRLSEYELELDGQFEWQSARVREARFGPLQSEIDLQLAGAEGSDKIGVRSDLDITLDGGLFPVFAVGHNELETSITAQFDMEQGSFDAIDANWALDGNNLSLSDDQLRTRLVDRTIAYNALSSTPIAMHFADEIRRNGDQFLQEFSANGTGTYSHNRVGYKIDFKTPLNLKAHDQSAVIKSVTGPEIIYDGDQQKIDMAMDVGWRSSRNLDIENLKLQGRSENGIVLTGIERVTAQVKSSDTWMRKVQGEDIRLAPLDIRLDLENSATGSNVSLKGDIEYDGQLPGGQATNLKAGGDILVKTSGDRFAMSFAPKRTIKMDEFISTTGWRAENISFELVDGNDVLTRSRIQQPLQSRLENVRADISSPEDDRHLQAQFDTLNVRSDFKTDPQIWHLDVKGVDIKSEDFPSPGTHVTTPDGKAQFTQYEDGSIEFSITSPVTEITTDNVDVSDLFIEMTGRPEDFSANYKAGAVQLKGGEIPEVPMEGSARLANGVLTGNAVAPMPRTKDTPINIAYRSEEGIGTAQVSIPKVVFTPRGLQPQYLIPTLRGKLAEVSGEASAEFEFEFGNGGPVNSFGKTTLKNMDIGTLVGPASGVSAELTFKSMFPLQTDGVQTATLAGFDAGIPLENGTIKFEMVPDGVRIDQALWPVLSEEQGEGRIYISPMLWRFGNVENRAVVNVENLSLGQILNNLGNGSLSATGQISGKLPATIKGVDVVINSGVLAIKDGGVIRYRNQGIDTFASEAKQPFYLGDQFAGSETGFAFKALENFEYKELEAIIDGPLDGDMTLRMKFGGRNPNLLAGTAFEFDVSVSGELGNIARDSIGAFDAQKHLETILEMQEEAK